MSRAWEAAGHGVPTGRSVSRVLLFLARDRTFTSRVLNPAPVHRDLLTPDFGKIQSERVFSMRKFHIVKWNNFDV